MVQLGYIILAILMTSVFINFCFWSGRWGQLRLLTRHTVFRSRRQNFVKPQHHHRYHCQKRLVARKVSVGNVKRSVKMLSVCASLLQNFQSRPFISSQDQADLTYYILLTLGMMRYNLVMTMTQTRTQTKTNGSGSKDKSKSLQKVQILKFLH